MPILMEEGMILLVKVTAIEVNKKEFLKGNQRYWRHDIFMEDQKGNTDRKEYLTTSPGQSDFFLQNPQPWQQIRCLHRDSKGDEIEPYEPQGTKSPLQTAKDIVKNLPTGASDTPPGKTCYNVPLTGQSITFAWAWAKDIMVAEIAQRGKNAKFNEEEDMAKMARIADAITQNICDRLQF
jgi:hypothetical protein